jgi:hypothetical protein
MQAPRRRLFGPRGVEEFPRPPLGANGCTGPHVDRPLRNVAGPRGVEELPRAPLGANGCTGPHALLGRVTRAPAPGAQGVAGAGPRRRSQT